MSSFEKSTNWRTSLPKHCLGRQWRSSLFSERSISYLEIGLRTSSLQRKPNLDHSSSYADSRYPRDRQKLVDYRNVTSSSSFGFFPSGVPTADFPSPVISINCIFLRHFNLSHVLFHHIHKPPFWPSPFPLSECNYWHETSEEWEQHPTLDLSRSQHCVDASESSVISCVR